MEKLSFAVRPRSRAWFVRQAERADEIFLIAELNEKVIGYLIGRVAGQEAKIVRLAASPQSRREGVRRQLTAFVLGFFKDRKVKSVRVEVKTDNQASLKFFRGFHFQTKGKLKGYYRDGSDAHLLILSF